jgi:hypothetical protein
VGVLHRRFPSVYLAYTWPPPIQYLSNIYPTKRKCLELGAHVVIGEKPR